MITTHTEAKAVQMFPGVVRRTMNSGERETMAEVTLDQGAVVPEHAHPHEQVGYVVNGRVALQSEGERREVRAGDSYLFHGDVPHQVTALEPSVLVEVFSPVRSEFLSD